MRRLLLHVGTHKTGTTSFQRALVDHREKLAWNGLFIAVQSTRRGRAHANCSDFANLNLRRSLRTGRRIVGLDATPDTRDRIAGLTWLRAVVPPVGGDVLVSAEALCFARTRAEKQRFKAAVRFAGFDDAVIILTTRRIDEWRASMTAEIAKRVEQVDGVPDVGDGTDNVLGDWVFDLDAIRSFWSDFGELREIDFDAAVAADGSVIPSLLEACDQPRDRVNADYRLNRRN